MRPPPSIKKERGDKKPQYHRVEYDSSCKSEKGIGTNALLCTQLSDPVYLFIQEGEKTGEKKGTFTFSSPPSQIHPEEAYRMYQIKNVCTHTSQTKRRAGLLLFPFLLLPPLLLLLLLTFDLDAMTELMKT